MVRPACPVKDPLESRAEGLSTRKIFAGSTVCAVLGNTSGTRTFTTIRTSGMRTASWPPTWQGKVLDDVLCCVDLPVQLQVQLAVLLKWPSPISRQDSSAGMLSKQQESSAAKCTVHHAPFEPHASSYEALTLRDSSVKAHGHIVGPALAYVLPNFKQI